MENEGVQRYVASLEQVIRSTHLDLRERMIQFQEVTQRFTLEQTAPPGIITDIRRNYTEISDQLTKIRGINQLMESRYRQYRRRDSHRDKEISEFAALSRSLYTKFESMLQEIEEKRSLKDKEEDSTVSKHYVPFQWFRSNENQVSLLRNLQCLYELGYNTKSACDVERRPRVIRNRLIHDELRSLSLFLLAGEGGVIDILQSRMRLREHDIKERYAKDELRGALTHLRKISCVEAEGVIKRFVDSSEVPKLRCLFFPIQSLKDLGKEVLSSADSILEGMRGGEMRTLQV